MRNIFLIIIISCLLSGCKSSIVIPQKETYQTEDFINVAISDFVSKCSLFKKDSVFKVSVEDTLVELSFQSEQSRWVLDTVYQNVLVVNVFGLINKEWYFSDAVIGSKGKLPSRYAIVKGKLFFWEDDNYPLTEETLSVFKKYNILTEMMERGALPDNPINDAAKAADYYFCRNDVSNYKRVVTHVATGYYEPPKLKCK
ncbi:hypothetical protein DWW10_04855 [Bacteroides intestinalis]|uniref:Lipoprotein n=1 Tax=Bacteroides intestinalis TaxID=329854 RepID=A0A412YIZ3_9BACE|nr:hypothetical protein [Bacteroides intestinalis]RGV57371.1 hypothetical protein DWW10_04855 [Bacteroides intestinalis]RHA61782.1 hypothetical protein DW932_06255 [Bacteroides intestinalis]